MIKCKSIFGHKYKPAITKSACKLGEISGSSISQAALVSLMDGAREQTFEGVYCQRCGDIKRTKTLPP